MGLLAHVLVSKYADHLPLYRQSQIFERDGLDLDRSTLADWVGKSTALLEPLANAIGRHVLAAEAIFADDTPIRMLATGTGKTQTARLWSYARDGTPLGRERVGGGVVSCFLCIRFFVSSDSTTIVQGAIPLGRTLYGVHPFRPQAGAIATELRSLELLIAGEVGTIGDSARSGGRRVIETNLFDDDAWPKRQSPRIPAVPRSRGWPSNRHAAAFRDIPASTPITRMRGPAKRDPFSSMQLMMWTPPPPTIGARYDAADDPEKGRERCDEDNGDRARPGEERVPGAWRRRERRDRAGEEAASAEAICEAVQRRSMRFVPTKTVEQQAILMAHRTRSLLVRQRTMAANALRAHLAEFGLVANPGIANLAKLSEKALAEPDGLPAYARRALAILVRRLGS